MEPIVIADSDGDDDEVHSPPFNHIEPPIEGHAELAGASDSTDPSFFKNVFNEHFQAAIDPLQAVELNRYGEEDELSHEFFDRGNQPDPRVAEPMAAEPDPWEIPSSPENPPKMMGFQAKKNRASGGTNNASPTRNGGPDVVDDESGSRRGKKRRLNHHNAPEEIPSQDPLAQSMPHDEPESQRPAPPDQSSMFPPTLPLPSRLVVAPNPLTNNQKMEYHSVDPQSSDLLSQDQGPALPRQIGAFERSSGSATNINTPRSQFVPSRSQNLDFSEPGGPQRVLTFNTPEHMGNQEGELPPLVGTAPPPRAASPHEIPHLEPIMEKPVASFGPDELAAEPVTTFTRKEEENESEFEDSFAQPKKKKKRGRPKKETAQKATAEAAESQIIEPSKEEATPNSGAKKKRGRPKKSDQQGAKPKAADADEAQDVKPAKKRGKKKASKSPDISKQDHEEGQGPVEECKNEDTKADCAAEIDQTREMPDTVDKKGHAYYEEPEHEKVETKSDNDEKPPERASKGKQATASPAKSLFSPGIPTKASYRVGLSKRSRVAPLLKIVRKDIK
ncbi:unnamed protein product [Clonostachys byssicola]|uniref:Uncharacterized protein n=1 Tax=Clonostachys byssicola TaxID=160290 RepID=A0A9N9U925_9HYPO|nr:unnamed protein product [Clonostachys byssicola]